MKIIVATLALCLTLPVAHGETIEHCLGENKIEHDMGRHHFLTTSRVYAGNGVETYETCVENLGTGDLWVDWLIPGPSTYVPPGRAVAAPRAFLTRNNLDAIGCLEYGSLADTMREKYIGHSFDAGALADEQARGCQPAEDKRAEAGTDAPPPSIKSAIQLFFPSDREKASETMVEFNAIVETTWEGFAPYHHRVAYTARPFGDKSAGNPNDLTIAMDTGSAWGYVMANSEFSAIYKGKPLGPEDTIDISIKPPIQASLRPAKYRIFDKNGKMVGAFSVPVWGAF